MDRTQNERREIERLYRLEFGETGELLFRFAGTLFAAVVVWLYTGWYASLAWAAAFCGMQAVYFLFLRLHLRQATRGDLRIARLLFLIVLGVFVWMPVRMIVSPDPAMAVAGGCFLTTTAAFLVRRGEQAVSMMLAEAAVFGGAIGIGIVLIILREQDPLVTLGLASAGAALVLYVVQTSFLVRRQRLDAEQAAERSAQAQKLEAIGQLAGGVAHDFNNVLTAIIGNLDLADEVDDPAERRDLIANARTAARRGARVVRQLLVYARQTRGEPHPVEARALLETVSGICRTLVPASVTLDLREAEPGLCVVVDESLFVAAMLNLVSNGADALEGFGTVAISARARHLEAPLPVAGSAVPLGPGDYVAFSVDDTGPGIPEDILSRVTDPFFTTKPVGKGSGLGLAMVVGFATRAGGGLDLRSSPRGTSAELLLPMATGGRQSGVGGTATLPAERESAVP